MLNGKIKISDTDFLKIGDLKEIKGLRKGEEFNLQDKVVVSFRETIAFIRIDEILLIIAAKDYTEIHTKEKKKFLISKTMEEWERRLPQGYFLRVHRSFIVNIECVARCIKTSPNTGLVYLNGAKEPIKLSRYYFYKLKNTYK